MLEFYMSEILLSLIILCTFALVAFAMFVMYKSLKDTRNSDLELVKKFSDMLIAGDYKTYETYRGYSDRMTELSKPSKRSSVDEEELAIDNITRNIK